MSFDCLHSCSPDAVTQEASVSFGNASEHRSEPVFEQRTGQLFGQPFDLHRYRVVFPDRWMAFLHAHFRDPVHVAFMFGVSERAARKWWEGCGAPRAEFALAACKHIPGAAEYLMEAA